VFLRECLDSVFGQTLPPIEVFIVDDNSDEATRAFLQALPYPVKTIRLQETAGAAGARNVGVAHARGNYIAFLDDDDAWEPSKLQMQTDYLKVRQDCAAVQSAVRAIYPGGVERIYDRKPNPLTLQDCLETPAHLVPSALLIRSLALRDVGGFDPRFRACEDQELSIRLVRAGHRIDFLPAPLVKFRRSGHAHLSGKALRVLRYGIAIAHKHRVIYESIRGPGALRRQVAMSLRTAGTRIGGVSGLFLRAAGRLASF
jgi:teichuronic acid biosynthesis glycosyltransferase TuaG